MEREHAARVQRSDIGRDRLAGEEMDRHRVRVEGVEEQEVEGRRRVRLEQEPAVPRADVGPGGGAREIGEVPGVERHLDVERVDVEGGEGVAGRRVRRQLAGPETDQADGARYRRAGSYHTENVAGRPGGRELVDRVRG